MQDLVIFNRLITAIREHPGKNDKIDILHAALHGEKSHIFEKLLNYALSPYITFGIKKIPEPAFGPEVEVNFYEILDDLAARRLTGDAAKETISTLLGKLSESEREGFIRILSKDLKAGFSASSVNKAKPNTISVFKCQLANSGQADLSKLKYPHAVEFKYDGVRCITMVSDGKITMLSRSGKPFVNFEDVNPELIKLADYYNEVTGSSGGVVFDGEIISGIPDISVEEGFQKVMKRAKADTGKHVEDNPINYMIFDAIPFSEWDKQECSKKFMSRNHDLVGAFSKFDRLDKIHKSPTLIANDEDHMASIYKDMCDQGYEGAITKDMDSFYKYKRNKDWQKIKPFETIDMKVVGIETGTGRFENTLGAVACHAVHDGKVIETDVGSGFNDAEREEAFNASDIIGRIIEVKYQDITKSPDNDNYSLRFPTFVRWRGDAVSGKM